MNQNACAPKAFIFDCDGTILDSMGMWLEIGPMFLARYGISVTPEDLARFEHLALEEECEAYHREWGIGASGEALFKDMNEMLREQYRNEIAPRQNVLAFLECAAGAGIPMSIATSTPAELVKLGLESNGLLGFFTNITTTGQAGSSKKNPDVYNLSLSVLMNSLNRDVPAHAETWVFEDAVFGLISSGKAGYKRVGIHDPAGRCDRDDVMLHSDIFIDDFSEGLFDRICTYEGCRQ